MFKDQPGIPTLVGYMPYDGRFAVVRKKSGLDLPDSLTVHQMVEQLLVALHNCHRQGAVRRNLKANKVEWEADKLIVSATLI